MTLEQHDTVDLIALDPDTDRVLLVMVEDREWGDRGALLPDFQAKLNAYLAYEEGQLARDYPDLAGREVEFQLRARYPPGAHENAFLRIVVSQFLAPDGILFSWKLIGATGETNVVQPDGE